MTEQDAAVSEELAPPAPTDVVADDSPEVQAPGIAPVADATFAEAVAAGLTWVPFAAYLGCWIVLAGVSAYLLGEATAEVPARWLPAYVPLLWTGIGLTAAGPMLSIVVWLIARARRPQHLRRGLFASAMTRGALAAFFGVAIWIATLYGVEMMTIGGTLG